MKPPFPTLPWYYQSQHGGIQPNLNGVIMSANSNPPALQASLPPSPDDRRPAIQRANVPTVATTGPRESTVGDAYCACPEGELEHSEALHSGSLCLVCKHTIRHHVTLSEGFAIERSPSAPPPPQGAQGHFATPAKRARLDDCDRSSVASKRSLEN
jgi:hypothetical protein